MRWKRLSDKANYGQSEINRTESEVQERSTSRCIIHIWLIFPHSSTLTVMIQTWHLDVFFSRHISMHTYHNLDETHMCGAHFARPNNTKHQEMSVSNSIPEFSIDSKLCLESP